MLGAAVAPAALAVSKVDRAESRYAVGIDSTEPEALQSQVPGHAVNLHPFDTCPGREYPVGVAFAVGRGVAGAFINGRPPTGPSVLRFAGGTCLSVPKPLPSGFIRREKTWLKLAAASGSMPHMAGAIAL